MKVKQVKMQNTYLNGEWYTESNQNVSYYMNIVFKVIVAVQNRFKYFLAFYT